MGIFVQTKIQWFSNNFSIGTKNNLDDRKIKRKGKNTNRDNKQTINKSNTQSKSKGYLIFKSYLSLIKGNSSNLKNYKTKVKL